MRKAVIAALACTVALSLPEIPFGPAIHAATATGQADLQRARDTQDRGGLDRAISELQPAAASNQPQGLYALSTGYSYAAEVAIEVKDKAKAETYAEAGIDAMKKAIAAQPNNAEYHRLLGELCGQVIPANILVGAVQYGSCARDEINRALELDPKNALAYVSRGVGNYYLPPQFGGSVEAAVKDFDKAISLNPKLDEAYLWKGIALRKLNQNAAAHQALETAAKLNPNRAWIKQQLDKTPAH